MENNQSPSYVIGSIVYDWKENIYPLLKSGDIDKIGSRLCLSCQKANCITEKLFSLELKLECSKDFFLLTKFLNELNTELISKYPNHKNIDYCKVNTLFYITCVDLLMKKDKDYEAGRKREE